MARRSAPRAFIVWDGLSKELVDVAPTRADAEAAVERIEANRPQGDLHDFYVVEVPLSERWRVVA